MFAIEGSSPPGRRQIRRLGVGQASDRVADRPGDEEEHHRCPGQKDGHEEALEAPLQDCGQADGAARDEVPAPDQGLDPEYVLEPLALAQPARERVPRARERARERAANHGRDEEGQSPDRVREDRLGEVDRRAVGGQADRRLDEHEGERDPNEKPVAAGPALVEVDQDGDRGGRGDPGREPAQPQAAVERAERQETLAQEPRQPRQQDAAKSGLF